LPSGLAMSINAPFMSTDDKTVPAPAPEAEQKPVGTAEAGAPAPHEVPEVIEFLRKNGTAILLGAGIAVAGYLGFSAYKNYKKSADRNAAALLFNSTTPEQLQQVVNRYRTTPAAPLAMLAMAAQYYDEGQFDLARHNYTQFQLTYPEHQMKVVAELGQALCLEATGPADDALKALDAFLAAHTNHYLRPMAYFSKARTLEEMGRHAEAKALYEDFVAANPDSRWLSRVEAATMFLDKEIRAKAKPAVPQPAPGATVVPPAAAPPSVAPGAPAPDAAKPEAAPAATTPSAPTPSEAPAGK